MVVCGEREERKKETIEEGGDRCGGMMGRVKRKSRKLCKRWKGEKKGSRMNERVGEEENEIMKGRRKKM